MTRRRWLWLLPLPLLLALVGAVLALPRFVANNAHRATIEALASSLTGRRVTIGGALSLALLPAPEIIAGDVTIGGAAGQVVTARSLTLDVALPALLRGRLAARNITLQTPTITLPWPLPDGPGSAVPPPWLNTLHAAISNGTVVIGGLRFGRVNADIFTGGNGALSVSGTGTVGAAALSLSLALGTPDAAGRAALSIDSRTPDGKLGGHFSGSLEHGSEIGGTLTATFIPPGETAPVSGTAVIAADAKIVTASDIQLAQAGATLTGTASFDLSLPSFALDLAGDGLTIAPLLPLADARMGVPGTLDLAITNADLPVGVLPRLQAALVFGANGITLQSCAATLAGDGMLTLSGKTDAADHFVGTAAFETADLRSVLAGFGDGLAVPAGWQTSRGRAVIAGDADALSLTRLEGSLGPDKLSGSVVLRRDGGGLVVGGDLAFQQLDLTPVVALLRQARPSRFSLAGELTAARASYHGLELSRVLLDVSLDRRLIVRRLSAALDGGVALADFSLGPDGQLTAGRAMLAVPSAAPLLALAASSHALPTLPPVLAHAPLSLYVAASGTATNLATSAVASLGTYSLTAAPVLDLAAGKAAGPLTLRHPDAIAAVAPFGVAAGLAWPGAGSIALRAIMAVSPTRFALPHFILSFGDLTADGTLAVTTDGRVAADIAAGTLALPPLSLAGAMPWGGLMHATGKVALTADQVWLGGDPIFGASAASLTLAPGTTILALTKGTIGGGGLTGTLSAARTGAVQTGAVQTGAAPSLDLKLNLADAAAASLALPVDFPFALPAGTLSGQAALHATGFAPAAWGATLAGKVSLTAANGQLLGFDLAALGQSPGSKNVAGWQHAATSGATAFTSLTLAGALDHGTLTLSTASLAGPSGAASAAGEIDLPDRSLVLDLALSPAVTPPATISLSTIGSWTTPKRILPKQP